MREAFRTCGLVFLLGMVLAAAPRLKPEDLVRQGNKDWEQGDPASAVECYTQAEERSTDPGLVAFNKATSLYQLGRYREAELHYRRCLEDAEGDRRIRACLGLANTLLQLARNGAPSRLPDAIKLFKLCLGQANADAELLADAGHNLELARLIRLIADLAKPGEERSNRNPQEDGMRDASRENEQKSGDQDPAVAMPDPKGKPQRVTPGRGEEKSTPVSDNQVPPPGKGNLPPIPDTDELVTLPPEDAAELLRQTATRILRERQDFQRRSVPAAFPNVKDW
jgi:tetratricopeptide (TPR) repeat protein